VRVNTIKSDTASVLAALAAHGISAEPEPWCPELLRLEPGVEKKLGTTLEHAMGHYYLQSASSAAAALILGPRPGEDVLDICAAPGSKTTLIAAMVGREGSVTANEPRRKRTTALVANTRRLGMANVLVTTYMGQNFPMRHKFDKVLVDAPCSGEGTWRGPKVRPKPMSSGQRQNLTATQAAILERAVQTLKPGGELVYSTCTYAPEENELVAAEVIERHGLRILETGLDVATRPGLTSWEGRALPPGMERAARFYPHNFDSEGFFVIRLAK